MPAFALCVVVSLLSACTTTDNPIGVSRGAQTDERLIGGWKGVFADRYNLTCYVFFLPRTHGSLLAMVVGWNPDDSGWSTYEVVMGKAGNHTLMNMRSLLTNGEPSNEQSGTYFPSLYRFEADGRLRLFMLSEDAAREAIQSGRIAGDFEAGQLATGHITADPKALDAFFAEAAPALFTEPYVTLQRVE